MRSRPDRWPLPHRSADPLFDPTVYRELATAPQHRAAALKGCGFSVSEYSDRMHPLAQSETEPPREATACRLDYLATARHYLDRPQPEIAAASRRIHSSDRSTISQLGILQQPGTVSPHQPTRPKTTGGGV